MTLNEKIMEVLQAMDDETTLEAWNEFQRAYNYDEEIFPLSEVCECFLNDLTFAEALEAIDKDEFDLSDDYAVNTIYGWKTFCDIFEVVDLGELANYIENEQETFNYPELEELFEEMEEDEED